MADTKGCCGKCCMRFLLHFSPQDLQHELRLHRLGARTDPDIETLVDMLIPLGKSALNGNGRFDSVESYFYTCRHFDRQTKLCTIYERRPRLCRTHGDVPWNPCLYDGCKKERPMHEEVLKKPKTSVYSRLKSSKKRVKEDEELKKLRIEKENLRDDLRIEKNKVSKLELRVYMLQREKALWEERAVDLAADLREVQSESREQMKSRMIELPEIAEPPPGKASKGGTKGFKDALREFEKEILELKKKG